MAESPLREQRHSLVQTVTDQLETPSLDDRQDQRSVELITDRLELPAIDDRLYRVILLPNQLEVLLVQDADTDKASAAMDVNVGNFSDPPELAGMCHIIEHMLFMGTKKVGDLQ
jgi:insulysin